mmetsp:Transcript_37020/g.104515  ORF Transcript_37020/g.104515 Transcript_37020/m.104515 type:complete len:299 (+) Transcript_37020:4226-5122(+)
MVRSPVRTLARWAIRPGLCSVGWRLVSMRSPSMSCRYTILPPRPPSCLLPPPPLPPTLPEDRPVPDSRVLARADLFCRESLPRNTISPRSSSTAMAPGYSSGPRSTIALSSATFHGVTLSGNDRRFAKYGGTPISPVPMHGSGEMTERAAKFTRLPIMLLRNSPSFFSRPCRMPREDLAALLFSAAVLSMSWLTLSCSSSHNRTMRAMSKTAPVTPSMLGGSSFWVTRSRLRLMHFTSITFWACSNTCPPTMLTGRKRLGATGTVCRKNILWASTAPVPSPFALPLPAGGCPGHGVLQ